VRIKGCEEGDQVGEVLLEEAAGVVLGGRLLGLPGLAEGVPVRPGVASGEHAGEAVTAGAGALPAGAAGAAQGRGGRYGVAHGLTPCWRRGSGSGAVSVVVHRAAPLRLAPAHGGPRAVRKESAGASETAVKGR